MRALMCRSYTTLPRNPLDAAQTDIEADFARGIPLTHRACRVASGWGRIAALFVVGCVLLTLAALALSSPPRAWFGSKNLAENTLQLNIARPCLKKEVGCLASKSCGEGFQCFEKIPGIWAACKDTCTAGEIDMCDEPHRRSPWTCKVLTNGPEQLQSWNGALRALMQNMWTFPSTATDKTTSVSRTLSTTLSATTTVTPTKLDSSMRKAFHFEVRNHSVQVNAANRSASAQSTGGHRPGNVSTVSSTQTPILDPNIDSNSGDEHVSPTTLTTIPRCGTIEHDVDYQVGGELNVIHDVHSAEACCGLCKAEHGCKSWVLGFWGGCGDMPCVCYLKSTVPEASQIRQSYSGQIAGILPTTISAVEEATTDGASSSWLRSRGASGYFASLHNKDNEVSDTTTLPSSPSGPTLFCYLVIMPKGYEPRLVKAQLKIETGVFACQGFVVYSQSEKPVHIGSLGVQSFDTVPIPGPPAWLAPVPNTADKVWHNTNVFARAWKHIGEAGEFRKFDFTVKADPDAVFMPARLRTNLQERSIAASSDSLFFLNCAQWGSLQGPLEVMSNAAAKVFHSVEGQQRCFNELPWRDWGEDWFVNNCLPKLGARAVTGYDLLDDQWCTHNPPNCWDDRKAAFHPFKTLDTWMKCKDETDGTDTLTFRK